MKKLHIILAGTLLLNPLGALAQGDPQNEQEEQKKETPSRASFIKAKKQLNESWNRFKRCLSGTCTRAEKWKAARDVTIAVSALLILIGGSYVTGAGLMKGAETAEEKGWLEGKPWRQRVARGMYRAGNVMRMPVTVPLQRIEVQRAIRNAQKQFPIGTKVKNAFTNSVYEVVGFSAEMLNPDTPEAMVMLYVTLRSPDGGESKYLQGSMQKVTPEEEGGMPSGMSGSFTSPASWEAGPVAPVPTLEEELQERGTSLEELKRKYPVGTVFRGQDYLSTGKKSVVTIVEWTKDDNVVIQIDHPDGAFIRKTRLPSPVWLLLHTQKGTVFDHWTKIKSPE